MIEREQKVELAQWFFEKQLGWNASAEIKTGVVVTLNLAMMSGLAALFIETTPRTSTDYWCAGVALACPLIALRYAALSVFPRLNGPEKSMLYFGRIGELDRDDYVKQFKQMSDSDLLNDILAQTHRNAQITREKFLHIRRANIWSFAGIVPWLVAVISLCVPIQA